MSAVYSAKDPHYALTCMPCHRGDHAGCVREFSSWVLAHYPGAAKRCACLRCQLKGQP